jgi:hypothetical protein
MRRKTAFRKKIIRSMGKFLESELKESELCDRGVRMGQGRALTEKFSLNGEVKILEKYIIFGLTKRGI